MSKKRDLTDLQAAFVEHYLVTLNATKSAKLAGYKGNEKTLASVGYENIHKPYIRKIIDARLNELAMAANEVIIRLSQHARGNIGEFIGLTEQQVAEHPRSHLVKKFKCRRRTDQDGNVYVTDLANGRILRFAPFPAPPPTAEDTGNMDGADNSGAEDIIVIPNDENGDTGEMPPAESTIELAFPEATDEVMPSEMTDEVDPPETTEEPAG